MDTKLILIEGGKTVVLKPKLPAVIGRGTAADLKLPDSKTSRRHCELYEYEGQLAVRDLGSVNGTVVNEHRIEQDTLLSAGDELTIGNVTFRIDLGNADPDAAPPEAAAEMGEADGEASAEEGDSAIVTIEPETNDSTVHSASAVLQYQSSGEGSVIGVTENDEEDAADDDDDLQDFLKSLGQ